MCFKGISILRGLRVRTPRGELEVDWRRSVPVIRY